MIRTAQISDAEQIAEIYNHYIEHTIVTFEEELIDGNEMKSRMEKVMEKYPWLVLEDMGEIQGYAYASTWKERKSYQFTVETTVYLSPNATQKGIGTQLYKALFEELKGGAYHVAIGGISLPNMGSVKLHENFGFEKVAHYNEVGKKFGKWIDVGFWQKSLD